MTVGRIAAVNRAASTRMTSIANLPGLKWWIEPDGITAGDATNIDSWTDKSGNGNTISETSTNRPTVSAGVLNGFNGARFTAANSQRLKAINLPLITGTAHSFGIVMRWESLPSTTNDVAFSNGVAGTNGIEFGRVGATNLYTPGYAGVGTMSANAITTGGFHTITWHSTGFSNGYFRYDRVQQALTSQVTPFAKPGGTSSLIVGSRANLALPADITIVAAFLCDGDLTSTAVEFAEKWWKAKYPSLP